jgi:hypothetical protein
LENSAQSTPVENGPETAVVPRVFFPSKITVTELSEIANGFAILTETAERTTVNCDRVIAIRVVVVDPEIRRIDPEMSAAFAASQVSLASVTVTAAFEISQVEVMESWSDRGR